MAISRTLEFLPEFLKTTANRKFLAATLDQLVSEPSVKKFNGYIGRQFFPGYQNEDRYVIESTDQRQNYQLEPAVVVVDDNNKVEFHSNYTDLVQQIGFYGGISTNHSRLFSNQSYTYDPHVNFDKLSNFGNYYWLPDGPDAVPVGIKAISANRDFEFVANDNRKVYTIKFQDGYNPEIVLRRGGTYRFLVNQPGQNFYIQSEPGTSGRSQSNPQVSTRNVNGVTNNGEDVGTITFVVPEKTAQNQFKSMPVAFEADLATTLQFRQIDNKLLDQVPEIDGFKGDLHNKFIVFVNQSTSPLFWTTTAAVDGNGNPVPGYPSKTIPAINRADIYQIKLIPVPGGTLVSLVNMQATLVNNRIFIKYGNTQSGLEYYRPTGQNYLQPIPLITADLDFLYYQNESQSELAGRIKIVDNSSVINIDDEIVGKLNYVSPNGVVFTNGLKVTFDNQVEPAKYVNATYIVEGVGKSIALIPFNAATQNNIDYITVARDSADRNDWSYTNRWTHESVIKQTADYLKVTPLFNQDYRAKRPVIEFEPNLQLFNFGREFIAEVDFFDTLVGSDAFGDENNIKFAGATDFAGLRTRLGLPPGFVFATGQKIIFSKDINLEVRKRIYTITIALLGDTNTPTILLIPDRDVLDYQNVFVLNGPDSIKNQHFYLKGNDWIVGQKKTSTNQLPLFDIVDNDFDSFDNLSLSSFNGSKIFGYKEGTGTNDIILGFPLSYRSINNIGDIEFTNFFEVETFQYLENDKFVDKKSSSGFIVKNETRTLRKKLNVWTTIDELTKQYQQYTVIANGNTQTYKFELIPTDQSKLETNLKVYLNGVLQNSNQYTLTVDTQTTITFPSNLSAGTKLDVLINSGTFDIDAFYQVPDNLEINPLNRDFEYLTLGQIRNHTREIFSRLNDLVGLELGSNNSKDLDYKNLAGKILQHGSPVVYANLFLTHDRANFVDSIHYAQREYSKFKNRFLEQSATLNISRADQIVSAVDQILTTLNNSKNLDSPWYYSDMVPYGNDYTRFQYLVLDVDIRNYYIETIFNDTVNSNRSVLVYHNGRQLVRGLHYSFSQTVPAIVLADDFVVELNDEIKIIDYNNTDGNYIPETPTKLGLYPKFEPKIYTDDRYLNATPVIQGHDGSITPCFGDYRDQILLELELRIYNNIKTEFDEGVRSVLHNVRPGKFRNNLYSIDEYNRVLSKSFLKWIGSNQLDYVNNLTYINGDSRTWNYKRSGSIFAGELLPGHWRAIFNYLYDTDRPNTHPWEMLGFSVRPDWWEETYGPGPYTGGNAVLWSDLEQGIIRGGSRAGVDARFARPGMVTSFIPVDEFGRIKSPAEFLMQTLSSNSTGAAWAIGDQGPVETAWRLSSDFPFAVQVALALTRPSEYFGLLIDNRRYQYDNDLDQLLFTNSKDRLRPEQILINGLDSDGNLNRISSYTNFVSDYLISQGINGSVFVKNLIDNLDVRLSYRLAGFSDKKNLRVFVEQSSPGSTNDSILVPQENYQLFLHKSAPNRRAVYSGVIIKKTATGYTVEGYDYNSPYFTIVPSRVSNNFSIVKGIESTAKVYQDYQLVYLTVPYGFEFTNRQQVVDFLVSYQRYLIGLGFTFNEFDSDLKRARDWILSATEFLTWSEQGWGEDSVIVLSPCVGNLTLIDNASTVDEINGKWTGSRLLDQNFTGIDNINFDVIRDADSFEIRTLNERIIGLADLALVQYEHVLILDNETVFNDVIYNPELGNRQYRLRINGVKSSNWTGRLNAPGFVFNNGEISDWSVGRDYFKGDLVRFKNRIYSALDFVEASDKFEFENWTLKTDVDQTPSLLINFAGNAKKFVNIYDVDADYYDVNLEAYSNNLIGFKSRAYLEDFSLDTKTQLKFYQGFIKEKGTANAVRALTRAKFNKITGDIDFAEEWAVRVGSYGSVDNQKVVEMVVGEQLNTADPFGVEILAPGDIPTDKFRSYNLSQLYDAPVNFDYKLFENRDTKTGIFDQDLTSAGFVKESEVDHIVFDFASSAEQISSLIANIGIGYTIWTAKDFTSQWNIFQTVGTDHQAQTIGYGLDNTCQITTFEENNFVVGDTIIIKDFDPILDGIYRIVSTDSPKAFTVKNTDLQSEYLAQAGILESVGIIFKLVSLKYNKLTDVVGKAWEPGSRVYLDNPAGWSVYEKTDPYSWISSFNGQTTDSAWGSSITLSGDQNIVAIGSPSTSNSTVEYYNIAYPDNIYLKTLSGLVANSSKFGMAMEQAVDRLFVGSMTDDGNVMTNDRNYVAVYDYYSNRYNINQIIVGPASHTDFGISISATQDKKWLAVGSPSQNSVYVYKLISKDLQQQQIETIEILGVTQVNYNLNWSPTDIEAVRVYRVNNQQYLLPDVDFVIAGNVLTFNFTPLPNDFYVVFEVSYYKLYTASVPSAADIVPGDKFGQFVKFSKDGKQLVVSSPDKASGAGGIYIFDRTVEAFISTVGQTEFISKRALTDLFYDVSVDGEYKTVTTDFTKPTATKIVFNSPLTTTNRVEIESNHWLLSQFISSNLPQSNSNFGQLFDFCKSGCNLYVGQPNYSTLSYQRGVVSRFVNVPYNTNQIVGSAVANPGAAVAVGDSIRINDQEITFTATTLQSVVNSIGNNVVGVTASLVGTDKIKISIDRKISSQPLRITTGVTNNSVPTLEKLGLTIFQHQQNLFKPDIYDNEIFGTRIKINESADQVLISGNGGFTDTYTTFELDSPATTFDTDSTRFYERAYNSGNVYEYELLVNQDNTSTLDYVQKLTPKIISDNDNFGTNVLITDQKLIVLSKKVGQVGKVDFFENVDQVKGWDLLRNQGPVVDLNSIGTLYLYNKRKNTIISYLDNVDPLRGKILGAADQEIDYKTAFDPAVYNVVSGTNISSSQQYFWSDAHVGRVWWDLDKVRYIEYQQDTLTFRFNNWGKIFPGSSIDVYEWVESPVPPSQYAERELPGTPKNSDDSAYTEVQVVDTQTGLLRTKYYFWVSGKVTEIPDRNISVEGIKNIIEQPLQQDIPYAAVLDDHSIALYNCLQFLNDEDIVLKVTSNTRKQELPIHNEWHLIKENDIDVVPEFIVTKMFDSIIGQVDIEVNGSTVSKSVPDVSLPQNKRYGILTRPRQGMFVRRLDAAKVYVEYLNRELAKNIIVGRRDLSTLSASDPVPPEVDPNPPYTPNYYYEFDTYDELNSVDLDSIPDLPKRFLVKSDRNRNGNWSIYELALDNNNQRILTLKRTQKFNVSNFWTYRNWYEEGFDSRTVPDYIVGDFSAAPKTGIQTGQLIKINNTGSGTWGVYRKTDAGYDPVALENATIEISSLIFDPESGGIGYESIKFDDGFYDYNPATDLRILLDTIRNDITIEDLAYIFNRSIFVMFEYVLYEQNQPDWLFKTSFISVLHRFRQLIEYPNYVLDNQDYYRSYIEEVKPYKTKIREYLLSYDGLDNTELDVTDFDYPVFFDAEENRYRHPISLVDDDIINTPPWVYWKNNSSYSIDSVAVVESGTNYQVAPTLVIAGGDGSARLTAVVSGGRIISVRVDNPGDGFFASPNITVYAIPNNDGSLGSGAVLKAKITNSRVRTMNTTVKFDRTEYRGEVANFVIGSPTVPKKYRSGDFFVNNGKIYHVLNDYLQTGQALESYSVTTTLSNAITELGQYSFWQIISLASTNNLTSPGYIKIDQEIFYYSNISGNNLLGVERAKFDTVPATHLAGAIVTRLDYKLASVGELNSAMKRSYYYYNPLPGMSENDVRALFSGVEYPGVKVQGEKFFRTTVTANITMIGSGTLPTLAIGPGQSVAATQAVKLIWNQNNFMVGTVRSYDLVTGFMVVDVTSSVGGGTYNGTWTIEKEEVTEFDIELEGEVSPELKNLDVWYRSSFLDTSLGVNAEDIDVSGGRFVDTANSHAPEELIPGRIYDTLDIRVFNKLTNNNVYAWRQFHTMNSNVEDADRNAGGIVQIINGIDQVATSFTVKLFDESPLPVPVAYTVTVTGADSQNRFTCDKTSYLRPNREIKFSGTVFGGVADNVTYYIKDILDDIRFTISDTLNAGVAGATKTLTPATGSMTADIDFYKPEIMINGELMSYTGYDRTTGIVSGLRRGLNGPAKSHSADSFITVKNNLIGTRYYYRVSGVHTTTLAQSLGATDTQIKLVDASKMVQPSVVDNKPGVIYIDGERIHYWTINYETNVIGQIIRGVYGTGIAAVHNAGTRVTSAGDDQLLESGDSKVWPPFTKFTARINFNVMTVEGNVDGTLSVGQTIYGPGIQPGTKITNYGSGLGSTGTYILNTPHNIAVLTSFRAGNSFEESLTSEVGFIKQYLSYTP